MARRKRQFLEDEDSDSSVSDGGNDYDDPNYDPNDPDARAERELFENPYGRKRRRKNAKDDAIYGVFASSDEEEDLGGKKAKRKSDWSKAPSFVPKEKVDISQDMEVDDGGIKENDEQLADEEEEEEELESGNEEEEEEEPSKPPSPRVREEYDEETELQPRFGGLGIGKSSATPKSAFAGFSKSGLGAFNLSTTTEPPQTSPPPTAQAPSVAESLPTSFGGSGRQQRSFVRDGSGSGSSTPRTSTPLPPKELAHFSKLGGTFGARMLEKMGWKAGQGLGAGGEGIATPVESKLRPRGMGLAFKGFKEKTEQSKLEAKRRGEVVSDEEEDAKPLKGRKAKAQAQGERSDAWKKPKKSKVKIEHKTYEQIVAEAGEGVSAAGIGQIIDATGATPREVSSLAEVSLASWTPTSEPMRLPELRHNLRLINDACKGELDGLAKEARALEERKKWIKEEDLRLRKKVEEEAELISRLQQVHLVVDDINAQAKENASTYEASLDPFSSNFDKLLGLYPKEFERYRLDEIVVAAIAPTVRRMLTTWHPLEDPTAFNANFRLWRNALKMAAYEDKPPESQVQVYGSSTVLSSTVSVEKPMTPYESLIWNAWLPKVRSSINNEWTAEDPLPAVKLYEAWATLLPPFVRDNFFDQLVLPKVHRAVSDWNPRKHQVTLQSIVFPWLPHVGLRLEDVLGDARRKVKSMLRSWAVSDGMPTDLSVWKDIFKGGDWDTMLLKYVVPKLGARMREDFRVNPRKQELEPLKDVLLWDHLLRPTILSQILEAEFFPKWLDVLHIWLIQPKASLEEVRQWYRFWKDTFPEDVQTLPGVSQGFTQGLQLMNKALELGPEAPTRLAKPEFRPAKSSSAPSSRGTTPRPTVVRPTRTQEITFRSIVEDYASSHNLLFIPTGKAHEKSRMPLFRVSQSADGKGGLLVYILDDAVWAPDGDEYRAITLESMVLRATKASW
ncbi:TFP11/STIP family protein [Abortiporus biennis]